MNEIITLNDPNPTAGSTLAIRSDVDADSALDLLQYVASWDNRKASRAQAEAWATSAQLAGWTMAEAREAVRWLLTHERDYLTPAMVTARIESQRHRARLAEEGTNPDGTKRITFLGALAVWREAFRAVGPNPSAEQDAKAAELLEQMLDGARNPVAVLTAATLAGRRMSPRIDWVLERIAAEKEPAAVLSRMPLAPVEYLRDDQIDVDYAVRQPDFPRAWRVYDPLSEFDIRAPELEDYLPAYRHFHAVASVPDHDPTPRDLPDWVVEHLADTRHRSWSDQTLHDKTMTAEELADEARAYRQVKARVISWIREDQARWERERMVHVRAWYTAHPDRHRAFETPLEKTRGWWEN